MLKNLEPVLVRVHCSEHGVNITEPASVGHISVNGVTLVSWNEYAFASTLKYAQFPVPQTEDEVKKIAALMSITLGYSDEIAVISDQERAFYMWKIFTPIRFPELPDGVDNAVADYAVNSGVAGVLKALHFLLDLPSISTPWLLEDALLDKINSVHPVLLTDAIDNLRWARMEVNKDFLGPSIVPGKIRGDGRAKRMSDTHRESMELLGFPPETPKYSAPKLEP